MPHLAATAALFGDSTNVQSFRAVLAAPTRIAGVARVAATVRHANSLGCGLFVAGVSAGTPVVARHRANAVLAQTGAALAGAGAQMANVAIAGFALLADTNIIAIVVVNTT